jgi:hypothetical protein
MHEFAVPASQSAHFKVHKLERLFAHMKQKEAGAEAARTRAQVIHATKK